VVAMGCLKNEISGPFEVQGCGTKLMNWLTFVHVQRRTSNASRQRLQQDPTHSLETPLRNQPCNGITVSVKSVVNEARLLTYHKNERRVRNSALAMLECIRTCLRGRASAGSAT